MHSVGWLRIVETQGGRGVHAGLFETSTLGDPLGFCFAKGDFEVTSATRPFCSLAEALYRSRNAAPTLLLGLAEEFTSEVLHALNLSVPLCCIHPATEDHGRIARAMDGVGNVHRVAWANETPAPLSAASEALGQIMELDSPLEPLDRAKRALAEAFSDQRVRTFMAIRGLETVISLSPVAGKTGTGASGGGERFTDLPPEDAHDRAGSELAERLWAVLAVPQPVRPSAPPERRLEWPASLMQFQRDGVHALIKMDRLLLSDDMGLGKTVQAVAALRILREQNEVRFCLVVAPASVLDQWRQEIARWAPELSAIIVRGGAHDRSWQWKARKDVTLVSYEVLRQDAAHLARRQASGTTWDVVVLDEAQRIKNRNETSETAKRIPRRRSWALTGTPIENDEEELASILEFVDHDEGGPRKRYTPGAPLRLRHRELQLRRRKADVLQDLPPKLETRLEIPLHRRQRESYDRAERDGIVHLRSLGADVGVQHVLELITRLKQICNADPKTGASSKLEDIGERLRKLADQGHKALIFSQYTSDVSGVAAAANHLREFKPLTLTGETPQDRRLDLINQFKASNAHKALIVSLRAGGLGLNLQEASYVFHLDRWWNPAVERQAEDRSHRLGQTVKVNVIKYTCMDTIEERIDRILRRKQGLFDQLVDDVSMDLSTRMNRRDLLELFGLN